MTHIFGSKYKLHGLRTEWQTKHEIGITGLQLITCQCLDFFLVIYPRDKAIFLSVLSWDLSRLEQWLRNSNSPDGRIYLSLSLIWIQWFWCCKICNMIDKRMLCSKIWVIHKSENSMHSQDWYKKSPRRCLSKSQFHNLAVNRFYRHDKCYIVYRNKFYWGNIATLCIQYILRLYGVEMGFKDRTVSIEEKLV